MNGNPINLSIVLCLILLISGLSSEGQDNFYSPATEDTVLLGNLFGKYLRQYKEELDKLPARNHKDFVDVYGQRWENIKDKFDKREIFTSAPAQKYLDAVVAEIVRANPILRDRSFSCYFSRSAVPNASYTGEGIILFNMGLFDRLDNESQLAFILCHEIAHFLLQHSENSISKYVTAINSAEVQAELIRIKKAEFHKHERVQDLVKGLTFDSRRHSRDHEAQADSMGLALLRNTRFDLAGALSALALLDVIDTDTLKTAICLQNIFNAKNYPFKKKWIASEEGLLGGHAHRESKTDYVDDSLKTHPDCKVRIRLLEPMVTSANGGKALPMAADSGFAVDPVSFKQLKKIFHYEVIEYAYRSENYSRGLFLALESLQSNPSDGYVIAQTGRFLNGIYAAQKEHRLGKVVSLPSPDYPPDFNMLLQFIQNLYLEDIAAISYNYLDSWHPQLDSYVLFKKAYEQSARNNKE